MENIQPWVWFAVGGGVIVLFVIIVYNGLVSRRVETQNAFSQIDVQLKRRYDLIPNLVETVKGYAKHEQETLEKVIQARNAAMNAQGGSVADRAAAENQLSGTLKTLFALSEAYPDLKANTELPEPAGGAVRHREPHRLLPAALQRRGQQLQHVPAALPGNIVAGLFGFRPAEFFTLDPAEAAAVRTAPKVQF